MLIGLLCGAVLVAGCAKPKATAPVTPVILPGKPLVTPDVRASGIIISVNSDARFVVVNFPGSNIPKPGRPLGVYRDGLKVGELKVTGPERDGNTVADIVGGQAQPNDSAREE